MPTPTNRLGSKGHLATSAPACPKRLIFKGRSAAYPTPALVVFSASSVKKTLWFCALICRVSAVTYTLEAVELIASVSVDVSLM